MLSIAAARAMPQELSKSQSPLEGKARNVAERRALGGLPMGAREYAGFLWFGHQMNP